MPPLGLNTRASHTLTLIMVRLPLPTVLWALPAAAAEEEDGWSGVALLTATGALGIAVALPLICSAVRSLSRKLAVAGLTPEGFGDRRPAVDSGLATLLGEAAPPTGPWSAILAAR